MKKVGAIVEFSLILLVMWFVFGCAPQKQAYKVTFSDGTVEYYELNYKPKSDAKTIEYDGNTIVGVEQIEKIK